MLDEIALALGGPAGAPFAGGSGIESGNLRCGDDVRDLFDDFELSGHSCLHTEKEANQLSHVGGCRTAFSTERR